MADQYVPRPNPPHKPLTLEWAEEVFSYDPASGALLWKQRGSRRTVGKPAGHRCLAGYIKIGIGGKLYSAHRIVWLLHTGDWPPDEIDHINCAKADNRITNLRLATRGENTRNAPKRPDSSWALKGIHRCGPNWQARISVNRRRIHLGTFDTPQEAHAAYMKAAREWFGEFANDGHVTSSVASKPDSASGCSNSRQRSCGALPPCPRPHAAFRTRRSNILRPADHRSQQRRRPSAIR